jgi:hypothetical protein
MECFFSKKKCGPWFKIYTCHLLATKEEEEEEEEEEDSKYERASLSQVEKYWWSYMPLISFACN